MPNNRETANCIDAGDIVAPYPNDSAVTPLEPSCEHEQAQSPLYVNTNLAMLTMELAIHHRQKTEYACATLD